MTNLKCIFLFFLFCTLSDAQTSFTIEGNFPQAKGKEIILKGFYTSKDSFISNTKANDEGKFTITYPENYLGAALLEIKEGKSIIVLLNKENFKMRWDIFDDLTTLKFENSQENDAFGKGLELYQNSEGKRAGLTFLLSYYDKEPEKLKFLKSEINIQEKVIPLFFSSLPKKAYARYYLNIRKLIADIPQTASRYMERMPLHEKEFNTLDFADEKLVHSGLYMELFDTYFKLLESKLDKEYEDMNRSTDAVIKSLKSSPELQQQVAEYLFRLFEKRSLFAAAEHLALSMLSDDSCQLDSNHKALFEQYRRMAKGNTAPELLLENTKTKYTKLSDIKNKLKLVVFGSSWCNKCAEEIPKIKVYYEKWKKEYDLEVVLVSLDIDKEKYESFVKDFSWISSCDYKGWEGNNARDYYVFGTPTMFLLDSNQEIVLKPISSEQINAWLDQNSVK
jgi:thiol-disulfide isomerase/thioredoxin